MKIIKIIIIIFLLYLIYKQERDYQYISEDNNNNILKIKKKKINTLFI